VERAIVLGGGGVTGIGWEIGVLAGLRDGGVDVAAADLVVGTSAGAFVGALLAGGADLSATATRIADDGTAPELPSVDFGLVAQAFGIVSDRSIPAATARARIGALAREAETGDPAAFVAWFAARLPLADWPPALRVTAVDAISGQPVLWDATSGVDLVTAIAASCAVPCVFPPVPVGGSVFMDGGARSVTNADLAAGAGAVIVLAPVTRAFRGSPTEELEALGDARHALVAPDAEARAAMGDNVFDDGRRAFAVAAGRAQGAASAAALKAVWDVGGSG
jgi:NTE family protein